MIQSLLVSHRVGLVCPPTKTDKIKTNPVLASCSSQWFQFVDATQSEPLLISLSPLCCGTQTQIYTLKRHHKQDTTGKQKQKQNQHSKYSSLFRIQQSAWYEWRHPLCFVGSLCRMIPSSSLLPKLPSGVILLRMEQQQQQRLLRGTIP